MQFPSQEDARMLLLNVSHAAQRSMPEDKDMDIEKYLQTVLRRRWMRKRRKERRLRRIKKRMQR